MWLKAEKQGGIKKTAVVIPHSIDSTVSLSIACSIPPIRSSFYCSWSTKANINMHTISKIYVSGVFRVAIERVSLQAMSWSHSHLEAVVVMREGKVLLFSQIYSAVAGDWTDNLLVTQKKAEERERRESRQQEEEMEKKGKARWSMVGF